MIAGCRALAAAGVLPAVLVAGGLAGAGGGLVAGIAPLVRKS